MPATIVVQSGRGAGQQFEIEASVVTVGGHPGCEICLAGEPETVATLRFRDGKYELYNRTDSPIELDGATIAPGAMSPWRFGKALLLASGTRLRLDVEGDGSPARKRRSVVSSIEEENEEDQPELAAASATGSGAKKGSDTTTWMLAGVLLIMILINFRPSDSVGSNRNVRKDFNDLITALLAPELRGSKPESAAVSPSESAAALASLSERATTDEQALFDNIRERLQNARIAELRNDRAGALSRYCELRDSLLALGVEPKLAEASLVTPLPKPAEAHRRGPHAIYVLTYKFVVAEIESISR